MHGSGSMRDNTGMRRNRTETGIDCTACRILGGFPDLFQKMGKGKGLGIHKDWYETYRVGIGSN